MKIITATDNYDQTHRNVLYLETIADLDEFAELSNSENEEEIKLAIKTDVEESRWDHLFTHTYGGMATGVLLSKFNELNPIINSGILIEGKLNRLRKHLEEGVSVIVNSKGGYFPCYDFMDIQIMESKEYVLDKSEWVHLKEDTRIINLENDLHLEPVAVKYMKAIDPNFSSIRKLKKFNQTELTEIFKEFKSNGGRIAYIYTTGIDVNQMYKYTVALIDAGIEDIRFEFNSGIDDKIKKFIDDFKYKIKVI